MGRTRCSGFYLEVNLMGLVQEARPTGGGVYGIIDWILIDMSGTIISRFDVFAIVVNPFLRLAD